MKIRKLGISVVVLTSLLFLSGCTTFQSETVGKFKGQTIKNTKAKKVSVCFLFRNEQQDVGLDAIPKINNYANLSGYNEIFQDALSEFSNIGSFTTFRDEADDVNKPDRRTQKDSLVAASDFTIEMHLIHRNSFVNDSFGNMVSILSASAIPVPFIVKYTLETKVYNKEHKVVASYKRKAHLTRWVQVLLLFVAPFYAEDKARERMYIEFLHDTFKQIESERVLG